MLTDPALLALIAAVFVLAGLVKGVIGLGLPLVALACLSIFIDLKLAAALIVVPSVVTNVRQFCARPNAWPEVLGLLKRLWPFYLATLPPLWVAAGALATADQHLLAAILGVVLLVYAVHMAFGRPFFVSPFAEKWLSPFVGAVNGVVTGLTGASAMPAVAYFQALNLDRGLLFRAMGLSFSSQSIVLGIVLGQYGVMTPDVALVSVGCLVAGWFGMTQGRRVLSIIDDKTFRHLFLAALAMMGVGLIARAI